MRAMPSFLNGCWEDRYVSIVRGQGRIISCFGFLGCWGRFKCLRHPGKILFEGHCVPCVRVHGLQDNVRFYQPPMIV